MYQQIPKFSQKKIKFELFLDEEKTFLPFLYNLIHDFDVYP